jgi:restriction endonuclease S subunit
MYKHDYITLSNYIVKIDTGKNYPQIEAADDAIRLIKTHNIRSVYADTSKLSYIDIDSKIADKLTEAGDLLFARVGLVGDCCVITDSSSGCAFSDNTLRVKLHSINPEFVAIWLSLPIGRSLLLRETKGCGRAVISGESIKNIRIPNIAIEKQNTICLNYRHAYQSHASKLRKADELLAGMDEAVLERLGIGDIPIEPRLAVAVTLGTIKKEKTISAQYFHPERMTVIRALEADASLSTRRLADIVDFRRHTVSAHNGKAYLGLAGVASETGELSGVTEEAEGQAFEYKAGDVLYARLRPYLNKVLYAEAEGICSMEFHVLRVNCPAVLPEYLAAIMRSRIIVAQTKHMMTGNTHPRLANDAVQNLRIPVPPLDVQKKIIGDMRKRIKQSRQLKHEAEAEWAEAKAQFERELM